MRRLRPKLTYANVMATVAVFIALGGASYAATQLPRNSVGTKQLKKSSVTGVKVKKGSLGASDFGAGQIPPGPPGSQGPPGPTQGFAAEAPGSSGPIPADVKERQLVSREVTLKESGKLFVFGRGEFGINCSAGSIAHLGLFVDNAPATASGYELVEGGPLSEVSLWGISDTVAAGSHTVSIGAECAEGTAGGGKINGDAAVGAILLGS